MTEDIFRRIADEREAGARRRREIAETIGKLMAEDAALHKRDADLETSERTLQSVLLPLRHPPPLLSDVAAKVLIGLEPEQRRTRRKPKDIPSVLQIADDALAHFEADGQAWVTARDVATFAREKYWPEAKAEYFNGQLWRAAERGDLVKKGSRYARKGTEYDEGLSTDVERPSHSNGAAELHSA